MAGLGKGASLKPLFFQGCFLFQENKPFFFHCYSFSTIMEVENWLYLKGNYYWKEPIFLTFMIMGGRVTPLGIPKNRFPSAISEFRNTQVQPGQQQYMVHISRVNVLQMTLCLLEASGRLRMILFFLTYVIYIFQIVLIHIIYTCDIL